MLDAWRFAFLGALAAEGLLAARVLGLGTTVAPRDWRRAFGTSPYFSHSALFNFRAALAVVFTTVFLASLIRNFDGGSWFFFLTNWSTLLKTVYMALLVYATQPSVLAASVELLPKDGQAVPEQPPLFRFLVALFPMQLALSPIVAALFWLLAAPGIIGELCAFRGGQQPCKDVAASDLFLLVFVHGGDLLLQLLSFAVGRIPFYFRNSGWFLLVTGAYSLWTFVHYVLRLGNPDGCGEGIPIVECPLYEQVDWSSPAQTVQLLALAMLVLAPASVILCWFVGVARDYADPEPLQPLGDSMAPSCERPFFSDAPLRA